MVLALPELIAVIAMLLALIAYILIRLGEVILKPIVVWLLHPHTALWRRLLTAPFRYVLAPTARFAYHHILSLWSWSTHAIIRPAVRWWHGLTILVDEAADWLEHFPAEVHWAFYHLRHIVIPRLIHAAVAPVAALAADAKRLAVDLTHDAEAVASSVADTLTGIGWITAADTFGALRNFVHAFAHLWRYVYGELTATVADVEALAGRTAGELSDLERYIRDRILGRLSDAEQALIDLGNEVYGDLKPYLDALRAGIVPAALIGSIVAALSLAWDGLFCRNTNQLGRYMCGLDSNELDEVLGGLLTAAALLDFRDYVRLAQGATKITAESLQELLQV